MSRLLKDLRGSPHHAHYQHDPRDLEPYPLGRTRHEGLRIAVVGAGIAGLRCAEVLIKSGVKVTIYEARGRIGGRAHQVESGGRLFDLGPNWIHGNTSENPISRIASRTQTVLHEWAYQEAVFDSNGGRLDRDEVTKYSDLIWEIITGAYQYSNDHSDTINPVKSLMDYFKDEVPKHEEDPFKQEIILKIAQRWGFFVGDAIEKQSLKFFYFEENIDGENAFVASTYSSIVKEIGATALAEAHIQFNTEVTHIDATYRLEGSSAYMKVRTASGKEEAFHGVVVTAPLGWLKGNQATVFKPALPSRVSEAIDNISYGHLEKCYISFPKAFWRTETVDGKGQLYPSFTHFLSPDTVNETISLPGNQSAVNLSALPGNTSNPTLLFDLYGEASKVMTSSIASLPQGSPGYNRILTSLFSPYYSLLPNYSASDPSCTPCAFLATTWYLDEFAGYGSYTNFQVRLEDGETDIKVMREGLPERGIWFAGEHTAPLIALGTTNGAYWAGEGVARRICARYGIDVAVEADEPEEMNGKVSKAARKDAAFVNGSRSGKRGGSDSTNGGLM